MNRGNKRYESRRRARRRGSSGGINLTQVTGPSSGIELTKVDPSTAGIELTKVDGSSAGTQVTKVDGSSAGTQVTKVDASTVGVQPSRVAGGNAGIRLARVTEHDGLDSPGDSADSRGQGADFTGRSTDSRGQSADSGSRGVSPAAGSPRPEFTKPLTTVARNPQLETRLRGAPLSQRLIGEYLLDLGIIDTAVLEAALTEQIKTGGLLGEILLSRADIDAASLPLALAQQHDLPSFVPEYQAIAALPRATAYRKRVAVLAGPAGGRDDSMTLVAVTDLRSLNSASAGLDGPLAPRLVDSRTMDRLLADAYAEVDGLATNGALRAARRRRLGSLGLAGFSARRRRTTGQVALSGVTASGALDVPPEHSLLMILSGESTSSLAHLHDDLAGIEYPRQRLQALAVYHPADRATRRALRERPLPHWVAVLAAPHNLSRGPRSLALYALRQARGETLTLAQTQSKLGPRALHRPAETREPVRERFLRRADPRLLRRQPSSFETAQLLAAFGWTADTACASRRNPS